MSNSEVKEIQSKEQITVSSYERPEINVDWQEKIGIVVDTFERRGDEDVNPLDMEGAEKMIQNIPASEFLKRSSEELNTLFLIDGVIDFHGNENAKKYIGLGDLLPSSTSFVRVDGGLGKRSISDSGKIGYLNRAKDYLAVFGGEKIDINPTITEEEKTAFEDIQPVENEDQAKEDFRKNLELAEGFQKEVKKMNLALGENKEEAMEESIRQTASSLGVSPAAIDAVLMIESGGGDFAATRFEPHIFLRERKAGHPVEEARKMATSFGAFQIMGFNHEVAGYESVDEMIHAMSTDIGAQFSAFKNFVEKNNLDTALRNKEWADFARGYNGPAYRDNNYDTKLKQYFASSKYTQVA